MFTRSERVRNEDSVTHAVGKTGNSWQDSVAKIAGQCGAADRKDWEHLARQRGEDSRTMRSSWQERLMKTARYRGENSRTEQSSWQDSVAKPARYRGEDSKTGRSR